MFDSYECTGPDGKKKKVPSNLCTVINNESCLDNGYSLTVGERRKIVGGSNIILKCKGRSRAFRNRNKGKLVNPKNHKSPETKEECCQFKLAVGYDESLERFYVRQNSGCSFEHNDHAPVERKLNQVGVREVPKETLDAAIELFKQNVPSAIVSAVVDVMSKNKLSDKAVEHLRRNVLMSKHQTDNEESTAVTLLRLLEDKQAPFEYMTGTYSRALKQVRVYKHTVSEFG